MHEAFLIDNKYGAGQYDSPPPPSEPGSDLPPGEGLNH